MTLSVSPLPRATPILTPLVLSALALGLVFSPMSTKVAGAVWLLWCLWGIGLRLAPRPARHAPPHPALPAVHAWAAGAVAAMGFAMLKAGYWSEPFDEVYAQLRLVLAGAAAWWVLSRTVLPRDLPDTVANVVAAQAAAAGLFVLGLFCFAPDPRGALPSNAIPWAQATAFCLSLLIPLLLHDSGPAWRRGLWWLALALGCTALVLSMSRGAYGVFAWMLWLLAARWRETHGCWPLRRLALLAGAAALALAAVWWAPGDPLRMRMAEQEIVQAEDHGVYNTSVGNRVYLWGMALHGLRESPLVGVGAVERLRRIRHAGEDLPEPQRERLAYVRTMGHVHNQYLHSALDGGLIGLAGLLALMLGMAAAAWRLRAVDQVASRQMQGLLFVHVVGGLTNVNFAHNYYVVSLAVASAVVLLGTRRAPAAA